MNRLEVGEKLKDPNSQCRFNAVLSQSLLLYGGPLVEGSATLQRTRPAWLTWDPFYVSPNDFRVVESLVLGYLLIFRYIY